MCTRNCTTFPLFLEEIWRFDVGKGLQDYAGGGGIGELKVLGCADGGVECS